MAYGFGSTVNPQLGATNYSGYLQGALSGAQMQAQGGAAIGQGIAQGLQAFTQGIEKYQKKKEEKKLTEGAIDYVQATARANPKLFPGLDPEDRKTIGAGVGAVGAAAFIQNMQNLSKFREEQEAAAYAEDMRQGNGMDYARDSNFMSPFRATPFSPSAKASGSRIFLDQQLAEAELAKRRAETTALGIPKTPTQTEFDKRLNTRIEEFKQRNNRPPSISERKRMEDEVVKTPNQAPDPYGVIAATRSFENDDKLVTTAQNAYDRELPRLYQTLDLLNSGNVNAGIFSELKTEIDRVKSSILNDPQAGKKASDSQVFDALTGSRVFSLFQQLGVGARGLDTPAERVFMIEVLTGRRNFELDALKELTRLAIKDNENVIKNYARKYETGALDRYFTSTQNTEPLIAIRPKEVSPDDWAFMTPEERDQFAIKKK